MTDTRQTSLFVETVDRSDPCVYIDEAIIRLRDRLGVGFHVTVCAPGYGKDFLVCWQRLDRMRSNPGGGAHTVNARTMREAISYINRFEDVYEREGSKAAEKFHAAELKKGET